MRLNGRIKQQTGYEVTASTLSDEKFYRLMLKMYANYYFSISKQYKLKTNAISQIKTVSDAFYVLVAQLLNGVNENHIISYIDNLKAAKTFTDAKNYTRLKNKILSVASKAKITEPDEITKELDNAIKNACAYQK